MHINSDHMADPEIIFWIGSSAGWMPIEVTQLVGGRRVYAQPNETGTAIVPISHRRQASLTDFAETWADNILNQGWLEQGEKTAELFPLGRLEATPGAVAALVEAGQTPGEFLSRHVVADWGDLDEHDVEANDIALQAGNRLLSAYYTARGEQIWIITEWNRLVTTLLLPTEY
jgi:hypothetical protein